MADLLIVDNLILTRIKNKTASKLGSKYSSLTIKYTNNDRELLEPTFPTVFVKQLQTRAIGETFDGGINAGDFTFQVDVYDNSSQTRAKDILKAIIAVMTDMYFTLATFPIFDNTTNVYRATARFTRVIGASDKL